MIVTTHVVRLRRADDLPLQINSATTAVMSAQGADILHDSVNVNECVLRTISKARAARHHTFVID